MAINKGIKGYFENNSLEEMEKWANKLSPRQINFALYLLDTRFRINCTINISKEYLIDILKNEMVYNGFNYEKFKLCVIEQMLSDEYVDWIFESNRAKLWFIEYIDLIDLTFNIGDIRRRTRPNYLENLIFNIDCYNDSLSEIRAFYLKAKDNYSDSYNKTLIDFSWIKRSDEYQLDWCMGYLSDKALMPRTHLFLSDDLENKYDTIMAMIQIQIVYSSNFLYDTIPNSRTFSPTFADKMHKAWIQKKWRDKKDAETALEKILSRKQFIKLLEISEEQNLKPIDIINNLISEKYSEINKS